MQINEATMTVNIAQIPRPFRVISKEQGKKEYGAPFYENLGKELVTLLRSVADMIRAENMDCRSARDLVREVLDYMGLEPVDKAGWVTQLMRFRTPEELADALAGATVEGFHNDSVQLYSEGGNRGDKEKQAQFAEAWEKSGESGREQILRRAGYTDEELSAYKKFTWENLPPTVRSRVEVVFEGLYEAYNPGAAAIRVPFHKAVLAMLPTKAPEEGGETPEGDVETPEGDETPEGTAVFESQVDWMDWVRKASGLVEADEPAVSPEDPDVIMLVQKAKEGDRGAQAELYKKYEQDIRWAAYRVASKLDLPRTDIEDLESQGRILLLTRAISTYDPMKGKFRTWLDSVLSTNLTKFAVTNLARERGGGVKTKDELSPLDIAQALDAAKELPSECKAALDNALAKLPENLRRVLELRFGLAGEARKMDLRDVGKILGVSRQTVLNWIEQAIEKLWSDSAVKELWRRCGDFLEWKSGNPKVTSWSTLSEEEIALFSKPKSYEFDWPHHAVAESIEYLLLREGVKVKRNGRKITIPVNEYGRFKKAFEKHGLTVPKKYVSNEAETIRKMARFSGQMGGKVLELPWK